MWTVCKLIWLWTFMTYLITIAMNIHDLFMTWLAINIHDLLKWLWIFMTWLVMNIHDLLGSSWLTLGGRPSDNDVTDDWLLILADWAFRMADWTADCTADWAAVGWVEDWVRWPLVRDWEFWEEELELELWVRDSWLRTCEQTNIQTEN
jgi:hypothetical protein